VVDEVRILRLLRSVTDDVSVLSRESGADESRREDPIVSQVAAFVTSAQALEAAASAVRLQIIGWRFLRDDGFQHRADALPQVVDHSGSRS